MKEKSDRERETCWKRTWTCERLGKQKKNESKWRRHDEREIRRASVVSLDGDEGLFY